jgi:hypothetical protein
MANLGAHPALLAAHLPPPFAFLHRRTCSFDALPEFPEGDMAVKVS